MNVITWNHVCQRVGRLWVSTSSVVQCKSDWERSKDRNFIDRRKIRLRGGAGGNGCVSFRKNTGERTGPADGGNGGHGGGVAFVTDPLLRDLSSLKTSYHGANGQRGMGAYKVGKSGKDLEIKVPLGTVLKEEGLVVADLSSEGQRYLAVAGGEGGFGNASFSTSDCPRPLESTEGSEGEVKLMQAELRSIADVGLVGYPNAGKSTLLRAISRARPAVAAYPFTTLNPHIGIVYGDMGEELAVADIPGLIEGAHENRGLGHAFLRHIERCKALVYVLDCSDPTPHKQLELLQFELRQYDPLLCSRPSLIVANKMDQESSEKGVAALRQHSSLSIVPVSALNHWNIQPLIRMMFDLCNRVKDVPTTLEHMTTDR